MSELVKAFQKFLMRDLSFILGGSAVVLSFLFTFDKIPDKELPTAIYILIAGFSYVIGYAVQDGLTIIRIVRTKAGVTPNWYAKFLYKCFERSKLQFNDVSKYETAKTWLLEKGLDRYKADHERIESLKQVGTAVGSCLLVSSVILAFHAVSNPVPFNVALAIATYLAGFVLWSLGWLKVTQQAQYVLSRWEASPEKAKSNDG